MDEAFRRYVRYPLEAGVALAFFGLFLLLPPSAASAVGGWLGRTIGPRLPVNRRARRNNDIALPGTPEEQKARIIRGMWDNLGRVLSEYPHIRRLTCKGGQSRVEVIGLQNAGRISDSEGGGIMFSGHFANWEIFALSLEVAGVPYAQVYRPADNPIVDRIILGARRLEEQRIIPKGKAGARKAVEILKRGGRIGMLVDQKLNDGIAVPFFGREAMTPAAIAQLALRFERPVVPTWLERYDGSKFRLTIYPPIQRPQTGDRGGDVYEMMVRTNRFLEERIRERPELWLWVHRRWPEPGSPTPRVSASDQRVTEGRAVPDTD